MKTQKECGKRLTFDTPSRAQSMKHVVSSSVSLSEETEACQSPNGEKKEEIAIEANDKKISSTAEASDVPTTANPTDDERKDENNVNDLPKNFADCTIGLAHPAKTSKKTDW